MKKLLTLILVAASIGHAQTYNVAITNSLLGPVDLNFTGTQVNVSEAVITGAVFNASNNFAPTNINNITINDPTEFITANHTSTPQSVRIWGGTNLATSVVAGANMDIYIEGGGGGGGGDVTINGVTTNNWNFVWNFPVVGSNIGNTVYWGLTSLDGIVISPAATNYVVMKYITSTSQTFVVPLGVSNIYVTMYGASGGGSAGAAIGQGGGGWTFANGPVVGGESLTAYIGQGGQVTSTSSTYSVAQGGWPDGGAGVSKGTMRSGSGGASSSLWRGTNWLLFAGGGGGTSYQANQANSLGDGGGVSGDPGGASGGTAPTGGTQTDGGITSTTSIPLFWTNQNGAAFFGGDAGATTNIGNFGAGGGGGGRFGGAGGLAHTWNQSGAGGSGAINPDAGWVGVTTRAISGVPAGQDDPLYVSGAGVYPAANSPGNNGLIIIRWETP